MKPAIRMLDIGDLEESFWVVGDNGITEIRETQRDGMHSNIPYLQVWRGETLVAEYCRHYVRAVHYATIE